MKDSMDATPDLDFDQSLEELANKAIADQQEGAAQGDTWC